MSVNSTKLHEAHIPEKQLSFQYLESFITTTDVKWGLFLPSTELEQCARAVDWALPARMYAVGHKHHGVQDTAVMGDLLFGWELRFARVNNTRLELDWVCLEISMQIN